MLLISFLHFPPYLYDIDAGVKVDGSLGFLAVLFVLVGVEDVRAVGELRQIEEPPFEDLQYTTSLGYEGIKGDFGMSDESSTG